MPDKKPTQHFDDPTKKLPHRRKGYRKLMIDDKMFQWRVYSGGLVVIIAPDDTRSTVDFSREADSDDWDYQRSISPSDVVRYAKAMLL